MLKSAFVIEPVFQVHTSLSKEESLQRIASKTGEPGIAGIRLMEGKLFQGSINGDVLLLESNTQTWRTRSKWYGKAFEVNNCVTLVFHSDWRSRGQKIRKDGLQALIALGVLFFLMGIMIRSEPDPELWFAYSFIGIGLLLTIVPVWYLNFHPYQVKPEFLNRFGGQIAELLEGRLEIILKT